MSGWQCDISNARKWDQLPQQAKDYVQRIEDLTGIYCRCVRRVGLCATAALPAPALLALAAGSLYTKQFPHSCKVDYTAPPTPHPPPLQPACCAAGGLAWGLGEMPLCSSHTWACALEVEHARGPLGSRAPMRAAAGM